METRDFVLARFDEQEEAALSGYLDRAAQAIELFLREGIAAAMNRFNAAERES